MSGATACLTREIGSVSDRSCLHEEGFGGSEQHAHARLLEVG